MAEETIATGISNAGVAADGSLVGDGLNHRPEHVERCSCNLQPVGAEGGLQLRQRRRPRGEDVRLDNLA